MRCRKTQDSLVAYLDGELPPARGARIRDHLQRCAGCRDELSTLLATRERIGIFFGARTATAIPSPQAWESLEARTLKRPRPFSLWRQRDRAVQAFSHLRMKRVLILAGLAALVLAACGMAFVPSARDQVGAALKSITSWFRIKSPAGDYEMTFSGSPDFTVLHPTYVPPGLESSGMLVSENAGPDSGVSFRLSYHSNEEFVLLTQTQRPAGASLPAGREMTVNDVPAVMVTGLHGKFEYGPRDRKDAHAVTTRGTAPSSESHPSSGAIRYTEARRLTWYTHDSMVELLSNLSEEEVVRVAESLAPADAGHGAAPFAPPQDLPSEGAQETVEYDDEGKVMWRAIESKIESEP